MSHLDNETTKDRRQDPAYLLQMPALPLCLIFPGDTEFVDLTYFSSGYLYMVEKYKMGWKIYRIKIDIKKKFTEIRNMKVAT